jgi:hypothetical protein
MTKPPDLPLAFRPTKDQPGKRAEEKVSSHLFVVLEFLVKEQNLVGFP